MSATLRNNDIYNGKPEKGDISADVHELYSRSAYTLEVFRNAKSKSICIYTGMQGCLSEAKTCLQESNGDENEDYRTVLSFHSMAQANLNKLARHQMKVVFFGRTSSGKSTVINAMLRQRILPSGIGHTTNCFLQLEGTDKSEGFLSTDESENPISIGSINQLASALSDKKLPENSIIRIFWPKENFRLLKEEVVLIDSPGIDITPDLDSMIDTFCLDADVFIFVGNAESTLMQTEKNFFHKVSSRLSKPNIFILQNRWDASADEEDAAEVKTQHYTRNIQFLTEELNVEDTQDAKNRIFFVSAKETLINRLHKDSETSIQNGLLQKNFAERLSDFTKFESAFELCISESAVHTKFQTHIERGKKMASDLNDILDRTLSRCQIDLENLRRRKQETAKEIDILETKSTSLALDITKEIKSAVAKVKEDVVESLQAEIRKLPIMVKEFEEPFSYFKKDSINSYKEKLQKHVTEKLECNLQQRFNIIQQDTITAQKEMTDRFDEFIQGEERHLLYHLNKRDFEQFFKMEVENACREFQEDVTFCSFEVNSAIIGLLNELNSLRLGEPRTKLKYCMFSAVGGCFTDLAAKYAQRGGKMNLLYSMIGVGSTVSLLFLYKWWRWSRSVEENFKKQFAEFVSCRLGTRIDTISFHCGNLVQQELSITSADLWDAVNRWKDRLNTQLLQIEKEIRRLNETDKQLISLRNKSDKLTQELISFEDEFLKKKRD